MSVFISEGSQDHDFRSINLYDINIKVVRTSASVISSKWAMDNYPNAKYVANYIVINMTNGNVDFMQIYF